jgi:hypothetical protein
MLALALPRSILDYTFLYESLRYPQSLKFQIMLQQTNDRIRTDFNDCFGSVSGLVCSE